MAERQVLIGIGDSFFDAGSNNGERFRGEVSQALGFPHITFSNHPFAESVGLGQRLLSSHVLLAVCSYQPVKTALLASMGHRDQDHRLVTALLEDLPDLHLDELPVFPSTDEAFELDSQARAADLDTLGRPRRSAPERDSWEKISGPTTMAIVFAQRSESAGIAPASGRSATTFGPR